MKKEFYLFLIYFFSLFYFNCYSTEKKYTPGSYYPSNYSIESFETEPQMEIGQKSCSFYICEVSDFLGHYIFSIPTKVTLLNWKAVNHDISNETIQYMKDYLNENNLVDVKVRFNQYAPLDDWKRLQKNPHIHWFAKYTVGVVIWLQYTFIPDRLLAGLLSGDHYNPFTNTINIYTDLATVVAHEGGHAKDFHYRYHKEIYGTFRAIPIIGIPVMLYREARASDDAIRYFRSKCNQPKEAETYNTLYPAYSTYIFGQASSFMGLTTSIPGHIWGSVAKRKFIQESAECLENQN